MTMLGRKHSPEAKLAMSESHKTSKKCQKVMKMLAILTSKRLKGKMGPLSKNWKGGRFKTSTGYWIAYSPEHPNRGRKGYVPEHRIVMEQKIGRFLSKKEKVHHLNGDRSDNRIENLILFSSNSEHIRFHRLTYNPMWKSEKRKDQSPAPRARD